MSISKPILSLLRILLFIDLRPEGSRDRREAWVGSPCHRPEWSAFKGLGCLGLCPENTLGTHLGFGVLLQDRPCCEEAKSEKTEGYWGRLELSPVCT